MLRLLRCGSGWALRSVSSLEDRGKAIAERLKDTDGCNVTLLVAGGLLTWIWVTDAVGDTSFNLIGQLYQSTWIKLEASNLQQIGLLIPPGSGDHPGFVCCGLAG